MATRPNTYQDVLHDETLDALHMGDNYSPKTASSLTYANFAMVSCSYHSATTEKWFAR